MNNQPELLPTELWDKVLIGGNHLANVLLGDDDPAKYRNWEYWDVLAARGQPFTDVWVAWKAIMNMRDFIESASQKKGTENG